VTHLRRIVLEQISQVIAVAAGLIDRIILTAVLFRVWGASLFEIWSACLAVTRLVSLFEFGFNLYFNNRLMIEPVTKRRLV